MKKFLIAFLVLLAAGCSAASIEVQEAVPANTVWSFSVTMPNATDFDYARVLLNGTRIASFYTYNGKIKFDEADIDRTRVFSNTEPIGNTVYFLVSPKEKGTSEISLEVDGETVSEEEVEFFEIYDAEEKADFQTQLSSLKGSVNSLIEQYNAVEDRLASTLTTEDRQQLQSAIDSVKAGVSGLESNLGNVKESSEAMADSLNQDIQGLNFRVNDLNKSTGFGIGLISLGGIGSEARLAIAFALIAVIAIVLAVKFRNRLPLRRGLYGKPGKEEIGFSKRDKDIAEQVMSESQEESRGKWAFGQKPAEPERKRFNIGDLIRKD